MSEVRSEK